MTSPLVGRDAELAAVTERVAAAGAGAGGALVVLGEAGVGKSRLLAEAARLATGAGLAVLTGRAVEGGGTYRAPAEALLPAVRDRPDLPAVADLRPYRAALGRLLRLPVLAAAVAATSRTDLRARVGAAATPRTR